MKTKSIIVALALFSNSIINAQKLKGSDTVLPLAQKEAESYMKTNKSAKLNVTGGGSGVGISALVDGTTDIAMSSRKIKLGIVKIFWNFWEFLANFWHFSLNFQLTAILLPNLLTQME